MTIGLKFTNNFSAPLSAGISTADLTVTLSAGYGSRLTQYAVGEYEYLTLVDQSNNLEIVKATGRSGDTLTILRAQDGTTARAWLAGDILTARPCRAALYDALEINLAKANVDSQAFTGTPSLPTGTIVVTQTQGNNSTAPASTAYADAAKAGAIAAAVAASSDVSILTGTIVQGGTIPLPSGYIEAECKWIVSPGKLSSTEYGLYAGEYYVTMTGRTLTSISNSGPTGGAFAYYMIIGVH